MADDQAEREAFKEKLRSLSFGYTYGKTEFHGPTVNERIAHMRDQAKHTGVKPEFVGSRWV